MKKSMKQAKQIAVNAFKEVFVGAVQYTVYLILIPAVLRSLGLDLGLDAAWISLYFAIVIILSVITGWLKHHPISIGFKLLRSVIIVYVFLTALNHGLIEHLFDGLVVRINFSILVYALATFTVVHSLLSSIDDMLRAVDRYI
ncbi:MAG: hypothetical protein QXP68_07130 [Thermosphaera sp.]